MSRKGAVTEGKGFTSFVSNDRVRVTLIELLDRINWWVTETVKCERKQTWSFVSTFSCFISPTSDFLVVNVISGRGVRKAGWRAGVFSRNNLPKIKDGMNLITLDDKKVKEHIGFHSLFIDRNTAIQLHTLILL